MMTRRTALSWGVAASVAAATGNAADGAPGDFRVVHMTDLHIQPELRAGEGCRMCIAKISSLKPDLVLSGGDLVFDADSNMFPRAKQIYDLYAETLKPLEAPVHTVIGNHDIFGVAAASGVVPSDPLYGKRMFEDRIGKRYYSMGHKGWRFVFLDSVFLTPDRSFVGRIDDEQLTWLAAELNNKPAAEKLIVMTHIPLITAFPQYAVSPAPPATLRVGNAKEVLDILRPYQPKAVLQGHTHVRETVEYDGCRFITSGAVCGNWWRGLRFGHPEGFGVLTFSGDSFRWNYETYGFHAAV